MPRGDAAIDQAVAVFSGDIDHRIVDPALLACFRIEREDTIEARGEVERAVHENRGGLQAAALLASAAVGNVADMKRPGDFKRRDILAIDLRERRIPRSACVVAVIRPIVARAPAWLGRLRRGYGKPLRHTKARINATANGSPIFDMRPNLLSGRGDSITIILRDDYDLEFLG